MAVNIGDRVGAILEADKETVHLLGYGVYEGEHLLPDCTIKNPKILLDDGNVVWGYQCWWAAEDKVRERIGNRTVVAATLND
jgi:hypothetical protein